MGRFLVHGHQRIGSKPYHPEALAFSLDPNTVRLSTISAGVSDTTRSIPSSCPRVMNALSTLGMRNLSITGTATFRDSCPGAKYMCSSIFFAWVELNSRMYEGRSLSVRGSAPAGSGGNELATFCCKGRNPLGDSGVGERLHHEKKKRK